MRQQGTQAKTSKPDENLKHVVSTACRPRVFQIVFFKVFPDIPHLTPPPHGTHNGHKSGNNDNGHQKPTELAHSVPTPRDMHSVHIYEYKRMHTHEYTILILVP